MKIEIVISVLALLISFMTFIYTAWWTRTKERIDAFSKVREVAVPNVNRFNGIMNSHFLKTQEDPTYELNDNDRKELSKIYSEVRDIYRIKIKYFAKSDRQNIDSEITTLEADFLEDPSKEIDMFTRMHNIMEHIESSSKL